MRRIEVRARLPELLTLRPFLHVHDVDEVNLVQASPRVLRDIEAAASIFSALPINLSMEGLLALIQHCLHKRLYLLNHHSVHSLGLFKLADPVLQIFQGLQGSLGDVLCDKGDNIGDGSDFDLLNSTGIT